MKEAIHFEIQEISNGYVLIYHSPLTDIRYENFYSNLTDLELKIKDVLDSDWTRFAKHR